MKKIRGRAVWTDKIKAVERCGEQDLGVVLVPTLVPGINIDQIGGILRWGLEHSPVVRGVHFQPVSYFGRYPRAPRDEDRFTLPELMREIELQTGGMMKMADFRPPGAENAHCSFHGNYMILPDGKLRALAGGKSAGCCSSAGNTGGARQAQEFVAKRWTLPEERTAAQPLDSLCSCSGVNVDSLDAFLDRAQRHSFCVSAMAFQDAWTLDLERLRECLIHVVSPSGTLVPFCAYNLTSQSGRTLYRREPGGKP